MAKKTKSVQRKKTEIKKKVEKVKGAQRIIKK